MPVFTRNNDTVPSIMALRKIGFNEFPPTNQKMEKFMSSISPLKRTRFVLVATVFLII